MASLFEKMNVAGYGKSTSANNATPRQLLDQSIDSSREGYSSALNTVQQYGSSSIDASREALSAANKGLDAILNYSGQAVDASKSGLDAILSGSEAVNDAIASIYGVTDEARGAYRDMLDSAGKLGGYAAQLEGVAGELDPYAQTLGGYGDTLWNEGTQVMDSALDALGVGRGFLNMDGSSSPLVAEALKLYGNFDPDKYVSGALQDVQSGFDNARGQTERQLSRMGVNPSSGAYAALQGLREKALAVAKTAAATAAKERGKKDQASMFQSLIADNATKFLTQGGSLASTAAGIQGQAANAQKGAADILSSKGSLLSQAGSLIGQQSQLYGSGASGLANLSAIYRSVADLTRGFNSDVAGAYNALASLLGITGNSISGAYNNIGSAYNLLAGTTQSVGSSIAGAQQAVANNHLNTEGLRVSALGGGGGVRIIDNTNKAQAARAAAGLNPIAS